MTKNKIITTLIIAALFLSSLAAYLIYQFMSPSRSTIYVFNGSYNSGEQLTSDMLTPIQVDSTIVVAGKKSNVASHFITPDEYASVVQSGDSLRMDVNEGMPLTSSMLSISGGSSVEMNMKSDAIAVTIPVDQFTGITNNLKEGARVNIYSNLDSTTSLIQQNKRILDVFKSSEGEIIGVSIEETIQESMELIYSATNGTIYLGLVAATGYQSSEGADPNYSPYQNNSDDFLGSIETNVPESETEEMETGETTKVFTP